jgi:hypothetical protein
LVCFCFIKPYVYFFFKWCSCRLSLPCLWLIKVKNLMITKSSMCGWLAWPCVLQTCQIGQGLGSISQPHHTEITQALIEYLWSQRIPAWHDEGHPVMRENRYHKKFSLNSTNNLKFKETSPEFITGEPKKKPSINICFFATVIVCWEAVVC